MRNPFIAAIAILFSISAPAQTSIFKVQNSPSPNVQGNILNAVSAISPSDAWAVGFKNDNFINDSRTLTAHFDGVSWKVVPSPNPASPPSCDGANTGNYLNAVAAVSANDVWAVGGAFNCTEVEIRPLVLHWDGKEWKPVRTPTLLLTGNAVLNGVTALASNNVYAVGYKPAANGAVLTLIEHWDGVSWSAISSPNRNPFGNTLSAISANAPNDIWAVGTSTAPSVEVRTLAEHFDGTKWSIAPSPNVVHGFLAQNDLQSLHATSASDVTAVGFILDPDTLQHLTLIEHWNGKKWRVVPSPNPSQFNALNTVTAFTHNNLYAFGMLLDGNQQFVALTMHFDGKSWTVVPSPSKGIAQQLNGSFAIPGTSHIWSVGEWSTVGIDPEDGFFQLPKTFVMVSDKATAP